MPAIIAEVASMVKKASAKSTGVLAKIVLKAVEESQWRKLDKKITSLVPLGSSAEDLVRHAAFLVMMWNIEDGGNDDLSECLEVLGLDLIKILDKAAPQEKESGKSETKDKRAKKK
jgi:hypothetical protein